MPEMKGVTENPFQYIFENKLIYSCMFLMAEAFR